MEKKLVTRCGIAIFFCYIIYIMLNKPINLLAGSKSEKHYQFKGCFV